MSLILDESSPGIAINVLSPKLPPCNKLPLDEMNCLSFGSCGCRSPLQATCWVLINECLYTWVCNSPSRLPNLLIPFQENGYSLEMMKTQWFGEDWSLFAWEKVKYRDRNFQSQFGEMALLTVLWKDPPPLVIHNKGYCSTSPGRMPVVRSFIQ